jgi:hypothetical protein
MQPEVKPAERMIERAHSYIFRGDIPAGRIHGISELFDTGCNHVVSLSASTPKGKSAHTSKTLPRGAGF